MAMLRIRTGGAELEVPDYASLHSMQAGGLIGPDAEIETEEGWKPVAPPPTSTPTGDDPWAAWNEVDERKAEQIYETYVQKDEAQRASPPKEDEAAELPIAAVVPMPRPVISSRPKAAREAEPSAHPPPIERVAQPRSMAPTVPFEPVSAYSPPPTLEKAALPTRSSFGVPDPPREEPSRQAPKQTPNRPDEALLRPGRIIAYVVGGLLVLGGIVAAVEMGTSTEPNGMSVSSAKPKGALKTDEVLDPLVQVERELRAIGLGEVHEVTRDGDLGDGILIDLQKLRLDVERVDAPVLRWVGRKQEDPEQAEVHVTFRSTGELDRELGAIALVVGRYKLRYSIDIPIVEALFTVDGMLRSQMLDDKVAEQFYANRTTLKEVLGFHK